MLNLVANTVHAQTSTKEIQPQAAFTDTRANMRLRHEMMGSATQLFLNDP